MISGDTHIISYFATKLLAGHHAKFTNGEEVDQCVKLRSGQVAVRSVAGCFVVFNTHSFYDHQP